MENSMGHEMFWVMKFRISSSAFVHLATLYLCGKLHLYATKLKTFNLKFFLLAVMQSKIRWVTNFLGCVCTS